MTRKKTFLILGIVVAAIVIAVCVFMFNTGIELPNSENVTRIEMERVHTPGIAEKYSDGVAATEHYYDIDSILTALSSAKKARFSWYSAANDVPSAKEYLAIRINAEKEGGTVYLYRDENGYYVYVPYIGIYGISQRSYTGIDNMYTLMEKK